MLLVSKKVLESNLKEILEITPKNSNLLILISTLIAAQSLSTI